MGQMGWGLAGSNMNPPRAERLGLSGWAEKPWEPHTSTPWAPGTTHTAVPLTWEQAKMNSGFRSMS